ncbi:MAG: coproporphyrinogen III oxidase [Chloroflexi bacterium HGW-Chloroflexi-2]|jgi:oxygen-independent coproporphyrinogen-3 oxidase|nr:MAG: coproporphyrinogen III oxidase [Chloroflexi bacterium HGW-Chloroflexi-2]
MNEAHSMYLHIPFCQKRCSYCDFNTFSGLNHLIPTYIHQLKREISFYGKQFANDLPVKTIFFGGGTPSLIEGKLFKSILEKISDNFCVVANAEISLEANPGTVTLEYLQNLLEIGFNRISFGLQTSNPLYLKLLGRIHDHYQSIQAIQWAKQAGFSNINLDLIYALPGQTIDDWKRTLEDGLNLSTQHISLYSLGIEENTPLHDWVEKGMVENPDSDLAAEMYEWADQLLVENGFACYEISNYYKVDEITDYRCQHNLQYWRNQPYLGLGAGAHGFSNGVRYENVNGIMEYINLQKGASLSSALNSPVAKILTEVDSFTAMQETMMVGLRLVSEGVSILEFSKRFSASPLEIFAKEIDFLMKNQLLEIVDGDIIRLTKNARLLGNQVFMQFVD